MSDLRVIHNSYQKYYREPFGAVVCGTTINLRLDVYTWSDDVYVQLEIYEMQNHITKDVKMIEQKDNQKNFCIQYKTPEKPCLVWYYFVIYVNNQRFYYCNNLKRLGGVGMLMHKDPIGYQITVYLPSEIPEWYKESIMYQIFVDRFYNGNENINVKNYKKNHLLHANWEDIPCYIKDSKGNVVSWDFFGGNLIGIIKKLPYLKKLGVGILYLNPIFEAVSNHKYDTGDYMKIDSAYGDEKIFEKLIQEADEYGISIILDGVFSHTGSDSLYFNKEGNYPSIGAYQSVNSPYFKWYNFEHYPDKYKCWWGVDVLPNVNELEPSYIKYIITDDDSVIKHWMKKGVKGWRLDVADEIPDEFIKELKKIMKSIYKDSILIGEVWEDASRKVSYGKLREYFFGEELDAVMNYPFREIFIKFVLGLCDAQLVHNKIMSLYENYPRENFYASMNLIGSHDRMRILTVLGEAPNEEVLTDEERRNYRLDNEQRDLAVKRLKLLSLIQFTFPGVPCIYYGDEVGVEGYSDPYSRGTYPWGEEDRQLLEWYIKLAKLRKENIALCKGDWIVYIAKDEIYGYYRIYEEVKILCLFNRSKNESRIVELKDIPENTVLFDLMENQIINFTIEIKLLPLQGRVLLIKKLKINY